MLARIYFTLGLAMLLAVLWDYRTFPKTARRLTREAKPGASEFSRILGAMRNLTLMALMAFFLWPAVLVIELSRDKEG